MTIINANEMYQTDGSLPNPRVTPKGEVTIKNAATITKLADKTNILLGALLINGNLAVLIANITKV